jgi:protein ImuB
VALLACVDIPQFPLQLLSRRHPEWRGAPMAVIDRDHPQGVITHLSERAYKHGVRAGMRYGVALGIDETLRAGEVRPEEIAQASTALLALTQRSSPRVEPSEGEPGVFWLDLRGLDSLYPDLGEWAESLWSKLRSELYAAAVVVGFRRFATYVIAKSHFGKSIVVLGSREDEQRAAERVAVRHLGLPHEAVDTFQKLRIDTVGEFVQLPAAGILRRFGPEAHRIHRLSTHREWEDIDAAEIHAPTEARRVLDHPESNTEPLLFLIKQELEGLLRKLAWKSEALSELEVVLRERAASLSFSVRPAEPTLDSVQIAGLVNLRLESTVLTTGATELHLRARGAPATREQLDLFTERPRRDLRAGARALSRLRALFGEHSVVAATLERGHLPEATYSWKPIHSLAEPSPAPAPQLTLVRRMEAKPLRLPPTPQKGPEGWLILGIEHGPVVHTSGPYALSGGWWHSEIQRDYYFVQLFSGEWLWVYFDRKRRSWFLQGRVR